MRRSSWATLWLCLCLAAGTVALLGGAANSGAQAGTPNLTASPSDVVFDFVPVGDTSAAKTVTVTSTGSADLIVSKLTLTGNAINDFFVTSDGCTNVPVAPSATCTFGVVFRPTREGTRVAHLRIESNAVCHRFLTLAGSGNETETQVTPRSAPCTATGSPGAAPTPVTPTPTSTTTPSGGAPGQSGYSSLCPGRRRVTIHFHTRVHRRIVAGFVRVANRKFKIRRVKHKKNLSRGFYFARLNFRGLTAVNYRVKIRGTLDNGKRFRRNRIFKNCIQS